MSKVYDLCVAKGNYTDRNTGEVKTRWLDVGAVIKKADGSHMMVLDRSFNPAGVPVDVSSNRQDTIIINMFEPKPRNQNNG